jgi:hypothetical protein
MKRSEGSVVPTLVLIAVSFSLLVSCNPREDCGRFRNTTVDSMKWTDLLKRAEKCLSPEEIAAIKSQRAKYEQTNLSDLFGVGKTIQEVINDEAQWGLLEKQGEEILALGAGMGPEKVGSPATNSAKKPGAWVIPEAVQFIYLQQEDTNGSYKQPDATSFILTVQDKPHSRHLTFLVTARHVLEPSWANCSTPNPDAITVRFNKLAGGVGYERISLSSEGKRLFYVDLTDEQSDLAVMWLTQKNMPHLPDYRFIDIPFHVLATDAEDTNLEVNQQVMTAGLLPDFPGEDKNFPIFKTGVISSVPDEPIKVDCKNPLHPKSTRLWLFTPELSPGASGSPVFTVVNRGSNAEKVPILIGVQSTTWLGKGVSGFTPSQHLVSLITQVTKGIDLDLYRGPATK